MKEQMKSLTKRLEGLLEEYGSSKNHVLYAKINIHDWSMFDEMNEVWDAWFDSGCAPARTCVQTTLTSGYLVEITLTAALIDKTK
jgi:enamine deaminase RidA (YjgF/YER057c/UK114 family)